MPFIEPKVSLTYTESPATRPYSEQDEQSPHPHNLFP